MAEDSCIACGGVASRFEAEPFVAAYDGDAAEVLGLSGWHCGACGEIVFDRRSAARYAAAGDGLIDAARTKAAKELKRIRLRLGLTQERAALLTGGGHNAFSRYERGEAPPMPAVINLFRLLDRHPELLAELTPLDSRKPGRPPSVRRATAA